MASVVSGSECCLWLYKDMRLIERLAVLTGYSSNSRKRRIIGGDFNFP